MTTPREIRKYRRAWIAWQKTECETCEAQPGSRCLILEEDTRRGYAVERMGTPRTGVHKARWDAYMATLDLQGRQELMAAQVRKGDRLKRYPHY